VVICAVIAGMTFVIVGCFYFRLTKCIGAYMVLSSFVLLSVMSATMAQVACDRYELGLDVATWVFLAVNFAVLGVVSIFVQDPAVTPR
jgi:p-aminobenzoyl-glutamate transporter AbgT